MNNKFLARMGKPMKVGYDAEAKAAKRLKARNVIGSGNMQGNKGDLITDTPMVFMIEVKSTTVDSMSLKYAWLRKVAEEALLANKKPALMVQYVTENGRPKPEGSWVMMPESLFRTLIEKPHGTEI